MEALRLVLSFFSSAYASVGNLLSSKRIASIEGVDEYVKKTNGWSANNAEKEKLRNDTTKHKIFGVDYGPKVFENNVVEHYGYKIQQPKCSNVHKTFNKCHTSRSFYKPKNRLHQRSRRYTGVEHRRTYTTPCVSHVRKTKSEDRFDSNRKVSRQSSKLTSTFTNITNKEVNQCELRSSVSEPNLSIRRQAAGQNMPNFFRLRPKNNGKEKACSSYLNRSSSYECFDDQFENGPSTNNPNHAIIGHRIPDDMINTYCERLQHARASVETLQGLLAMQFITCEPDTICNLIDGKHRVFQVIFDCDRMHYVLLEYIVRENCVRLYDSMLPSHFSMSTISKLFQENVCSQIRSLFGHLFQTEGIPVVLVCGLEAQDDGWSCGFRVIFYLTLRVFNREVESYDINMEQTAKFFNKMIDCPSPLLSQFQKAILGEKRQRSRETQYIRVHINKDSIEIFL